jgi:hypothetical protein
VLPCLDNRGMEDIRMARSLFAKQVRVKAPQSSIL